MATLSAMINPLAASFFLQLTLEGWRHGRNTPPLTLVDWYDRWDESVDDIRASEGIEAFRSVIPDMALA